MSRSTGQSSATNAHLLRNPVWVFFGLTQPILYPALSGVLLPMTLAPAWLRHTSRANPLTYVVDATRALFRGDFGNAHVRVGALVTLGLGALLARWGTRMFQRQSA